MLYIYFYLWKIRVAFDADTKSYQSEALEATKYSKILWNSVGTHAHEKDFSLSVVF